MYVVDPAGRVSEFLEAVGELYEVPVSFFESTELIPDDATLILIVEEGPHPDIARLRRLCEVQPEAQIHIFATQGDGVYFITNMERVTVHTDWPVFKMIKIAAEKIAA